MGGMAILTLPSRASMFAKKNNSINISSDIYTLLWQRGPGFLSRVSYGCSAHLGNYPEALQLPRRRYRSARSGPPPQRLPALTTIKSLGLLRNLFISCPWRISSGRYTLLREPSTLNLTLALADMVAHRSRQRPSLRLPISPFRFSLHVSPIAYTPYEISHSSSSRIHTSPVSTTTTYTPSLRCYLTRRRPLRTLTTRSNSQR